MTYENYIKARMVEFVVNDAYHDGIDGMCAVAQVLANRVNAGWGEWKKVIDTALDYTGTIVDPLEIDPRDATFRRMLALVDDIYHGVADDSNVNVEDDRGKTIALYYANLNDLGRNWFRENVLIDLKEHPRIATVGQLTFFA